MSALENPQLEEQLAWSIVAKELYLRWAFDEETSINLTDIAEKVNWVLFLTGNWLAVIQKRDATDLLVDIAEQMGDSPEDIAKLRNNTQVNVKNYIYLTPAWKELVESQVALIAWVLDNKKD